MKVWTEGRQLSSWDCEPDCSCVEVSQSEGSLQEVVRVDLVGTELSVADMRADLVDTGVVGRCWLGDSRPGSREDTFDCRAFGESWVGTGTVLKEVPVHTDHTSPSFRPVWHWAGMAQPGAGPSLWTCVCVRPVIASLNAVVGRRIVFRRH